MLADLEVEKQKKLVQEPPVRIEDEELNELLGLDEEEPPIKEEKSSSKKNDILINLQTSNSKPSFTAWLTIPISFFFFSNSSGV